MATSNGRLAGWKTPSGRENCKHFNDSELHVCYCSQILLNEHKLYENLVLIQVLLLHLLTTIGTNEGSMYYNWITI